MNSENKTLRAKEVEKELSYRKTFGAVLVCSHLPGQGQQFVCSFIRSFIQSSTHLYVCSAHPHKRLLALGSLTRLLNYRTEPLF